MGSQQNKCPRGHDANIYGECFEDGCPFKSDPQQRHGGTTGR